MPALFTALNLCLAGTNALHDVYDLLRDVATVVHDNVDEQLIAGLGQELAEAEGGIKYVHIPYADASGHDLDEVFLSDAERPWSSRKCAKPCSETEGCIGWTFVDGRRACYLKGADIESGAEFAVFDGNAPKKQHTHVGILHKAYRSINFNDAKKREERKEHGALGAEDEDVNALLKGLSPSTREAEKDEAYADQPRNVVSCDVDDGACQASAWTSLGEDWWLPFIDGWAHRWGLQVFDETEESKQNGQEGKMSVKLRNAVDAFDAPSSWVRWEPPMLVHINALLLGKGKSWEGTVGESAYWVFTNWTPRSGNHPHITGKGATVHIQKGQHSDNIKVLGDAKDEYEHQQMSTSITKMLGDAFDEYERTVGRVSVADWAHPHKALTPVLKPLARLFSTLAEMHPFVDGNSRTRTIVLHACMVRAGGHPLLLPDNGWWIYNVSETSFVSATLY